MSDQSHPVDDRRAADATTEREELRTISFRMREIQRLLSMRVEQENRRLEAEGIDPVEGHGFSETARTE
jgi:hypothetical protein